jgi:hypothetical protein
MSQSSPRPEVLYLPAIFRAIREGAIRVPAFQRGFVWKPAQIHELLESVYRSYPIGSLLFWHVDAGTMRSDDTSDVPFPHPPVDGIVDFVLDGMQRVSSLYGAFNQPGHRIGGKDNFAIAFDLAEQRFLPVEQKNESSIELRKLFTPKLLLEEQARLGNLENGDLLVERSLELQRRFQEYLIPVVRIGTDDSAEVVRIFERVNSTGTTLSAVDFMRALTWSADFDLSEVLDELHQSVAETGFEIPTDTIAKSVALELRVPPISEEMVRLRDKAPRDRDAAVDATRDSLLRVARFLRERLGIHSYDYVPYEGQFLVLMSAAASRILDDTDWFERWYWTTGFSEAFQGRPDHYIARMALGAREGGFPPSEQLSLTVEALRTRPMRKGSALPMTYVASLGTSPLSSVITGRPIDSHVILGGYEASMIASVFDRADLEGLLSARAQTEKVVANAIILAPEDVSRRRGARDIRDAILDLAREEHGREALGSQFIDRDCVEAIAAGNPEEFLESRSLRIRRRAQELAGQIPDVRMDGS